METTFQLPPEKSRPSAPKFFRVCAHLSWAALPFAFLLVVGTSIFVKPGPISNLGFTVLEALVLGSLAAGFVCPIIALYAIRKYGWQGLLIPSIVGISLWVLLIADQTVGNSQFKSVIVNKLHPPVLQPVLHVPGAKSFSDSGLHITFDLPAWYLPCDERDLPARYADGFMKRDPTGESHLLIRPARPVYSQIRTSDFPAASRDLGDTTELLDWRGLPINCLRMPEKRNDVSWIIFSVQVPLRSKGLDLVFEGPVGSEPVLRAAIKQVLDSLEAPNPRRLILR